KLHSECAFADGWGGYAGNAAGPPGCRAACAAVRGARSCRDGGDDGGSGRVAESSASTRAGRSCAFVGPDAQVLLRVNVHPPFSPSSFCRHKHCGTGEGARRVACYASSSAPSTLRKAFCGTSTLPTLFMRFLPSFCFSKSLRLRVTSPP